MAKSGHLGNPGLNQDNSCIDHPLLFNSIRALFTGAVNTISGA